jgi:hypothetical protein
MEGFVGSPRYRGVSLFLGRVDDSQRGVCGACCPRFAPQLGADPWRGFGPFDDLDPSAVLVGPRASCPRPQDPPIIPIPSRREFDPPH